MVKAVVDKKFLQVQKDEESGELYMEFPDDLLENMDWNPGDTIVWTELSNGMGYTVEKVKTVD
jgi:hypothetical protein